MNISKSISVCCSKYATFSGRASRSEYWWFILAVTLLSYVIQIVFALQTMLNPMMAPLFQLIFNIMMIILAIPEISAGSRRLHDIGKSGWWQLISFTIVGLIPLIIWLAKEGDREENIYGQPEHDAVGEQ